MGKGYTVEEQLTGEASVGGLQIQVFPMKKEFYERFNEQQKQGTQGSHAAMDEIKYDVHSRQHGTLMP